MICSCSDKTPCHIGDCGGSFSHNICRLIDHKENQRSEERPSVDNGAMAGDRAREDLEENGHGDAENGYRGIKEEHPEDDTKTQSNDDGPCEYKRLRLERITQNNTRLTELGFNNDWEEKKTSKRRSTPVQPQ